MPARSAAVDLYSSSLPPRHRATVARWRGGKEAPKASTAADRAGIISFPNVNPRKIRPCNKFLLIVEIPKGIETKSQSGDLAPHFYGLRTERICSSQLKSLRIKKTGESRGFLRQKLHLAGCTIIVGAGRGGADEMGVRPYLPGTGTRYQVPIMYCKTYYTVNTRI